jgi:DNA-binding beta-propeller fold protein YncE
MHILPQLRKLEGKYANELMVIGVHSAKFPAEKEHGNLTNAVHRYGLQHPVVNDIDFQIWQQYACRAWPSLIFIDPLGKIVGKHEGEISYESLDSLMGRMVVAYDAQGLLDRNRVCIVPGEFTDTDLSFPGKVVADAVGDRLFISDSNHNRIVITYLNGVVRGIIGSNAIGLLDGDFDVATFNHPQGMALVGDSLYVADTGNHALRRVDLIAGIVETVAGTGNQGHVRAGPGPGLSVALSSPWDLVCHNSVLYIAMSGLHQIWSMIMASSEIGPYAGNGQESLLDGPLPLASMAQPSGLTADGNQLYFVDSETSSVRAAELNPMGRVSTIVGLDLFVFGDMDGSNDDVRLQHPMGITCNNGSLYVADTYNHKIKQVSPTVRTALTLFGSGEPGLYDGPALRARFNEPSGLSIANGMLYIADTNNHCIRVADLNTGDVSTLDITGL